MPKNKVLAYALFELVANQGNDKDQENRDRLKPNLTPDQLAEVREILVNWKVGTPFPTKTKY